MTDAVKRISAELERAFGDDVRDYVIDQSCSGGWLERVGYYGAYLIWREIESDVRDQVAQALEEDCGPAYSPVGDRDAYETFCDYAVDSIIDFDESFADDFGRRSWFREHNDVFF